MPENEIILFTDDYQGYRADKVVHQPNLGWPRATLMRYHAMLKQRELLSRFSHVFYMDVDTIVCSKIEPEEILSDGIAVTLHPGYVTTFERNPVSTAYVEGDNHNYFQGCFVGGKTEAFFHMCETISKNIDTDDGNGVMAIYHDESHLNRYMIDNTPAKILTPAYCFPGPAHIRFPERWLPKGTTLSNFVPRIRHLEKPLQNTWKSK